MADRRIDAPTRAHNHLQAYRQGAGRPIKGNRDAGSDAGRAVTVWGRRVCGP